MPSGYPRKTAYTVEWSLLLRILLSSVVSEGFLVKNPASEGDSGSFPESGRSPGGGNGNSLQYSCLKNSMDRGAWWAKVHGVAKNWT